MGRDRSIGGERRLADKKRAETHEAGERRARSDDSEQGKEEAMYIREGDGG